MPERSRPTQIGKVPKAYRALIAEAEAQGWVLERRKSQHFALRPPAELGGSPVFFSSSPRDGGRFTTRKVLADLKRRGFTPGGHQ